MGAKIAAFLLTMTACLTAAVISLSIMIIAMNGYSESDATWGLGAFAVLAFLTSIGASVGSTVLASKLLAKQFTTLKSLLIAVPVGSIVGVVLVFISSFVGIGVAELARVKF